MSDRPEQDPGCLEGPGRTREQVIADARELDRVAPTASDKFALMFGHAQVRDRLHSVADEIRTVARDSETQRCRDEYLRLAGLTDSTPTNTVEP